MQPGPDHAQGGRMPCGTSWSWGADSGVLGRGGGDSGVLIDYGREGQIVGIEIIDQASRRSCVLRVCFCRLHPAAGGFLLEGRRVVITGGAGFGEASFTAPQLHAALIVRVENPHMYILLDPFVP